MGAGIAQWHSAGLRAVWSGVWIPAGAGNIPLHHRVQTSSGAHTASYPMGTRGSFPGGKTARAWSWPLRYIYLQQTFMKYSVTRNEWHNVQITRKCDKNLNLAAWTEQVLRRKQHFHCDYLSSRPCATFRNKWFFYGELLAPRPIPKLEDHHPLSAGRNCLTNIHSLATKFSGWFYCMVKREPWNLIAVKTCLCMFQRAPVTISTQ
jgi:hypothetical protein